VILARVVRQLESSPGMGERLAADFVIATIPTMRTFLMLAHLPP